MVLPMTADSYRQILSSILEERQKVNPSYSLRAFAKSLDFDSARLSRILNGKQGLSLKAAQNLAENIGFGEEEGEVFCLMVQASDSRSKKVRLEAKTRLVARFNEMGFSSKNLGVEDYEILREWYNIAILEMVELDHFDSDPKWIAKELGITTLLAKKSLEKLLKMGLLERKQGRYLKTQKILKIDQEIAHDLMKGFYQQLLLRAQESIYLQNYNERYLSSVTVTLDQRDIDLLNDEIQKFRSQFNQLAESLANQSGKRKEHVFCFSTQFFKVNMG